MATLRGREPKSTFGELLKIQGAAGVGLTDELLPVGDGSGEHSPLKLSKTAVSIDGDFSVGGAFNLGGSAFPTPAEGDEGKTLVVGVDRDLVWEELPAATSEDENVVITYSYTSGLITSTTYQYGNRSRVETYAYEGSNIKSITSVEGNMTKVETFTYDSNDLVQTRTVNVTIQG